MSTARLVRLLPAGAMTIVLILCCGCSRESQPEPRAAGPPPGQVVPSGESAEAKMGEVVATDSGLQYIDLRIGDGPMPTAGQAVVVEYTGTLADGTKFDSTADRGSPFQFEIGMGQVIFQLDEGISTMRVGGKRKLIIPPASGYAEMGRPGKAIPPDVELHFEVELLQTK